MARGYPMRHRRPGDRLGAPRRPAPTPAELETERAAIDERLAAAQARERRAMTKIHHPAVQGPSWKCYRVVRLYRRRGLIESEDLSRGTAIAAPALMVMTRELGRARVLDPNGNVVADNLQPIEDRG